MYKCIVFYLIRSDALYLKIANCAQHTWTFYPIVHLAKHRWFKSYLQVNGWAWKIEARARYRTSGDMEWLVCDLAVRRLIAIEALVPSTSTTLTEVDSKDLGCVLEARKW